MEIELAGKPLLIWSLEAMAAVCGRVIVVAGFGAEKVGRLLAGRPGTELVVNDDYASGMLTSVQAGCLLVRAPRFFILPGDMPLVKADVFRRLLASAAPIAVPSYRGRHGHPVLLDSRLIPPLLAEAPVSSLGRFIARSGCAVVEVDDPGILADLDDMEDTKRIGAALGAGG